MNPLSISSSSAPARLWVPSRPALAAVTLFAVARCVFLFLSDAFIPYPETLQERQFYIQELRLERDRPTARIVAQGTSRLKPVRRMPVPGRTETRGDRFNNLSIPGNRFWEMALRFRRDPWLLDDARVLIIDVMPFQIMRTEGYSESSALFLRESTLREKWLVLRARDRARALLDTAVPIWSERHSAANWRRALLESGASTEARLEAIARIRLGDFASWRSTFQRSNAMLDDPEFRMLNNLRILFTDEEESRIAHEALQEILDRVPESCEVLLIHPPFSDETVDFLRGRPRIRGLLDTMRGHMEALVSERVHLEWFEHASEMGLLPEDYRPDGVHLSESGLKKFGQHLGRFCRPRLAESKVP